MFECVAVVLIVVVSVSSMSLSNSSTNVGENVRKESCETIQMCVQIHHAQIHDVVKCGFL